MENNAQKPKYTSAFDKEEFGKRIRKTRKSQGLSQKELAKITAEHREASYVCNFEKDNNATTLDGAVDIANALGVSLDYLCNRDDFINRPVTMGDLARALMILPFLDKIDVRLTHEDITKKHTESSFGTAKTMPVLQIKRGSLRRFFCEYQGKLTRSSPEEFIRWLQTEMKRLDNIAAWDERHVSAWQRCVDKQRKKQFPEDKLQELIWSRNPDYGMDLGEPKSEP